MADFCQQCSIELFNEDFGDLADLGQGRKLSQGDGWLCLCEGCGPTTVDDEGRCQSVNCLKKHGAKHA